MLLQGLDICNPRVLGRSQLGQERWAYLIESPFDMDERATGLIGITIRLDDRNCEVRGIVPNMPVAPIRLGQPIQLLVLTRAE